MATRGFAYSNSAYNTGVAQAAAQAAVTASAVALEASVRSLCFTWVWNATLVPSTNYGLLNGVTPSLYANTTGVTMPFSVAADGTITSAATGLVLRISISYGLDVAGASTVTTALNTFASATRYTGTHFRPGITSYVDATLARTRRDFSYLVFMEGSETFRPVIGFSGSATNQTYDVQVAVEVLNYVL
jgi:hypothetical protein